MQAAPFSVHIRSCHTIEAASWVNLETWGKEFTPPFLSGFAPGKMSMEDEPHCRHTFFERKKEHFWSVDSFL